MRDIFFSLAADQVEKNLLGGVSSSGAGANTALTALQTAGTVREGSVAVCEKGANAVPTTTAEEAKPADDQQANITDVEMEDNSAPTPLSEHGSDHSDEDDVAADAVVVGNLSDPNFRPPWLSPPPKQFQLPEWLRSLQADLIETLIEILSQWITNTRTATLGCHVVSSLLTAVSEDQLKRVEGFNQLAKAVRAYGQRHAQRWSGLLERSYYIDFLLNSNGLALVGGGGVGGDSVGGAEAFTTAVLFGDGGEGSPAEDSPAEDSPAEETEVLQKEGRAVDEDKREENRVVVEKKEEEELETSGGIGGAVLSKKRISEEMALPSTEGFSRAKKRKVVGKKKGKKRGAA